MNDIFSLIERDQFMAPAGQLLNYAKDNEVLDLHYGALPEESLKRLLNSVPVPKMMCSTMNHYASPKGDDELRALICQHYCQRYGVEINPENEILLTNGSTEALALSVLSTSNVNDTIAVTDPTYPMYKKTAKSLGRRYTYFKRSSGLDEYATADWDSLKNVSAFIVNSPENPTGYVLSTPDWESVKGYIQDHHAYLIHDELMGLLDFYGNHKPAICMPELKEKALLVGGMSKSFALPGLRLGWLIASRHMIKKAQLFQRDLYLGISPISESIAKAIFKNADINGFISETTSELSSRMKWVESTLKKHGGYQPSEAKAGLSAVIDVSKLYEKMPERYKPKEESVGTSVARYLFEIARVSTMPAVLYGDSLSSHIKLAICQEAKFFQEGVRRLASI